MTLVLGVATYYLLAAARGYVLGNIDVLWTAIALVAGPVMGLCGAASRAERPPVAAVIAPGAMLVAEALFLADDRKVWRWNLKAEPYRLIDLAVMVAMLLGGLALTAWLDRRQRRRGRVLLALGAAGVVGGMVFVLLKDLIVRLA